MPDESTPGFETSAVAAGETPHDRQAGDLVAPIHLATTFAQQPGVDGEPEYTYARGGSPTRHALEARLAALEGGGHALACSSGMGAIATTVLSQVSAGDHVVAFDSLYGGTRKLFDEVYGPALGLDVEYVDATSPAAVERAVTDETALLWVESPTNPLVKLCDVDAVAEVATAHGVPLCVDSTFASPAVQQPLDLGADVVVHSTTKYVNGHSDSLGGVVVARDEALVEDARLVQTYGTGAVLSPFDSYLVLRGAKTLPARMDRHQSNAMTVATSLQDHPNVEAVNYPGLPSHPQHDLAQRQMDGHGGMLSFELTGGQDEVVRFLAALERVHVAVSLGGVESMVAPVATMTHAYLDEETRAGMGLSDSLVRMSVGIERSDDIVADLQRGLDRVESGEGA